MVSETHARAYALHINVGVHRLVGPIIPNEKFAPAVPEALFEALFAAHPLSFLGLSPSSVVGNVKKIHKFQIT